MQGHLRAELDRAPAGDVRLISLCAGQGRDVIGVLTGHPRRDDVRARLVELHQLTGEPDALMPGQRLFTVVGRT